MQSSVTEFDAENVLGPGINQSILSVEAQQTEVVETHMPVSSDSSSLRVAVHIEDTTKQDIVLLRKPKLTTSSRPFQNSPSVYTPMGMISKDSKQSVAHQAYLSKGKTSGKLRIPSEDRKSSLTRKGTSLSRLSQGMSPERMGERLSTLQSPLQAVKRLTTLVMDKKPYKLFSA
jgi:hypothetical protein